MAWRRGVPSKGQARKRSEAEIADDRAFLVGLLKKMGKGYSVTEAAEHLNARRSATARQTAIALGKSESEADLEAEAAKLSVQSARRDVRVALDRLRRGTDAVAAVWLDDQIEEAQRDLDSTYRIEDQIYADLERSRNVRWVKTKSRPSAKGKDDAPAERQEYVRKDAPGDASLWAQLIRLLKRREDLRSELRYLRYGRALLPERPRSTFAESITGADNPEQARQIALRLYEQEVEALCRAEEFDLGILAPDLIRQQKARAQAAIGRLSALRSYIALPQGKEKEHGSYEIVFTEIANPKLVGPGAEGSG